MTANNSKYNLLSVSLIQNYDGDKIDNFHLEAFSHAAITARKLFTHLYLVRYSFIPLHELRRRGEN